MMEMRLAVSSAMLAVILTAESALLPIPIPQTAALRRSDLNYLKLALE